LQNILGRFNIDDKIIFVYLYHYLKNFNFIKTLFFLCTYFTYMFFAYYSLVNLISSSNFGCESLEYEYDKKFIHAKILTRFKKKRDYLTML